MTGRIQKSGVATVAFLMISLAATAVAAESIATLSDRYLDCYFQMFPSRATAAGRHEFDADLEDFSPAKIAEWIEFNRAFRQRAAELLREPNLSFGDELDGETLLAQVDRELNSLELRKQAERNPLYWSTVAAESNVFLLVRDDLPLDERKRRARARGQKLPRFAKQARDHFATANPSDIAPELCQIAAGQVRSTANFYKEGFVGAIGADDNVREESNTAAAALVDLANTLEDLAKRATGSVRLGPAYEATFRTGTGVTEPVRDVLARAQRDLAATHAEAAAFGRSIWAEVMPKEQPPANDAHLLRRLFDRIAADHGKTAEDALAQWRTNVSAIEKFVHGRKIMTLPDPLTLIVDLSPAFFVGQSVGGVYPPGPYAPDAKTILFLPMPSRHATPEQREAFFRDFNEHFNKMIVPHELIPGHYVQFKIAAHQPHKIRTVFPDPLYVEGWGTFCERIMLDQGWGGPLERLAHLKKQLENIARTIVDIRVHTENMSRDEVVRFVTNDALQGEQLASNMWTRAITTSPQITTYYLGYEKVRQAYDAARTASGDHFELRKFMDGVMELGPVRLDHYIEKKW
jgi:Bacterial protein of unknown function (DUF885)